MTLQFGCPCGRSLTVSDERRGTERKCPDCARLLIVPQSSGGVAQEVGAPPAEAGPAPVTPQAASGTDLPTKTCPKCAARIAVSALACRHCGAFLDASSDSVTEKLKGARVAGGLPCERPGIPFWTGMFQTLRMIWLQPRTAFRGLATEPALGRAFLFAAILGALGMGFSQFWGFLIVLFASPLLPAPIPGLDLRTALSLVSALLSFPIFFILTPVFCVLSAGVTHLGLTLTGATRSDFATTLAVALYVTGATYFVGIIPCCGIFLSLWILVLYPLALVYAHEAETWKAIVAVYWPVLLCCIPLGVFFLLRSPVVPAT